MSRPDRHERFVARATHGIKIDQSNASGPNLLAKAKAPSRPTVLTKILLIKTIEKKSGLLHEDALAAVELVLDQIQNAASKTGQVELVGYGTFSVSDREEKIKPKQNNGVQSSVVHKKKGVSAV